MARSSFVSDHDVRVRTYRIWVRKGKPDGRAEAYWREALVELQAEGLAKGQMAPSHLTASSPTETSRALAYIALSETYTTGVQTIDAEHGDLMDLINDIHRAIYSPAQQDELKDMFQHLADSATTHFRQEELQFVGSEYADASLHARQHEHLKLVLSCFHRGTDRMGRPMSYEDQVSFVRDWLLDHIANEDRQFGHHINAH